MCIIVGASPSPTMATETAAAGGDIPPNQTIYINNLNEKIKKDALKSALYACFSQFGKIMDVVAMRDVKLRGQAWVVFENTGAATKALQQMQGFEFFDKKMKIQFAKTKSDAVAKKDGTYQPKPKRVKVEKEKKPKGPSKPPTEGASAGAGSAKAATPGSAKAAAPDAGNQEPHSILFVQNLPEECTKDMLVVLFQQYMGFQEVRLVPGKKGIAFIEFSDIASASFAREALNGFKLSQDDTISVTYAKK